ncbi:DOMON-like domain-containing protein [Sphingomonas sp. SUN019]|uniref:DOMON-like domain-containing protein n=1 Tax=Sphingomonas sp. SUN019 TaxID=2937788 RepID=UPI00216403C3|nr:DOMON-like domain-containing protein [Sphingomonas sp. SUN019]UVO49365.1 DOMON-like domain-containing protein [Sphingomonas sp. SUN019]
MHRFHLIPHPNHPPLAVREITVELHLTDRDDVLLTYVVEGAERLIVPELVTPERADGLWKTTCFELFLMFNDDDERYVEFNFSPSTRWAAYTFDGYREGMAPLDRDIAPQIERLSDRIEVDCDLGGLPPGPLRMALTAVIEEQGERKSFWSLAHPPGAPDFHNPACFVARLPAPDAS